MPCWVLEDSVVGGEGRRKCPKSKIIKRILCMADAGTKPNNKGNKDLNFLKHTHQPLK